MIYQRIKQFVFKLSGKNISSQILKQELRILWEGMANGHSVVVFMCAVVSIFKFVFYFYFALLLEVVFIFKVVYIFYIDIQTWDGNY